MEIKTYTLDTEADVEGCREFFQGREIVLYNPSGPVLFDGESSYKTDFPPHDIVLEPVHETKYKGSTAPFLGTSSYKEEYREHTLEPRGAVTQPYLKKTGPFVGSSSYNDDFKAHPVDPEVFSSRPAEFRPSTAHFEGQSSYRSDFKEIPISPRGAPPAAYRPSTATFQGHSSYKDDFKPYPIPHAEPLAPTLPRTSAPFRGQSSYREDFKPHPVPHVEHAAPEYHPSASAHFPGISEMRDSYQEWPVDPSVFANHDLPPLRPSAPFSGSTTQRDDYKGWKIVGPRPALSVQMAGDRAQVLIPQDAALPASGHQVFTTVHHNQAEICVIVLCGANTVASRNRVLGQFVLKGLPPGSIGTPRVEVTFSLDADSVLSATARDLDAQRQQLWLQNGVMEAVQLAM